MMALKAGEINKATGGKIISGDEGKKINGICIDSRQVKPGDLFIALAGENTDGHLYLEDAFANGATAALVTQAKLNPSGTIIQVADTLKALQDLAGYYRQKFAIPLVGVTGSNGKTTTKDMISSVLGEKFNVLKTSGNFNNELGLPLTLMELNSNHDLAVLEMGMRGLGQIAELVKIAKPTMGVITNIGLAHVELLGSREKIAQAKGELIFGLPENGVAILNGEDEYCRKIGEGFNGKTVYYGFSSQNQIRAVEVKQKEFASNFTVVSPNAKFTVQVPLPGEYNILNALAAVAIGLESGLNVEQIQSGLINMKLTGMRLERVTGAKGEIIINDTYNANPDSMIASLTTLNNFSGNKKVAVLGDMYELGEYSETGHRRVGKAIAGMELDLVVTVGQLASVISRQVIEEGVLSIEVASFSTKEDAVDFLKQKLSKGDVVLVKGSRGMAMEDIIYALGRN